MLDLLRYWRLLPVAAKRYIFYHCMVTPLLFVWYIVPYLMLETGMSAAEAGLIFTASSAVSALANVIVGRWLDRGSPNAVMATISLMEGTSYALYYLAFTAENAACVLLAAVVERLSFGLYPVYAVYEYEAYPEEIREKAYVYHNVLPLASQAITYPLMGYALGVVWRTRTALLTGLLVIAIASYLSALLPLLWLPRLGAPAKRKGREPKKRERIPRSFYPVAAVLLLVGFAGSIAPPLALVNLFREALGGGLFEISLYEAVSAVAMVTLSLPLLRVEKEKGRYMVALGLGLMCASSLLLVYANALAPSLLAAFLSSAGYAIMDPFYMDILFSKIPREVRGTLLGGIAGVRRVISIASPALAGILADALFPAAPYAVSAAAEAASIPLTLYATRAGKSKEKNGGRQKPGESA